MKADCHIHMVLDGMDWKSSISRGIREDHIRGVLEDYRQKGYTYLRDGGDRWNVGKFAAEIAPQYGIVYKTPLAPFCKKGHYGSFIGICWETMGDFARMVAAHRQAGGDFIKIMISGLMDFDRYGVLTEPGLTPQEIQQLCHIAKEEGFSVMAHCNGAESAIAAALAGVDSIEHGAYLNEDALQAMKEAGTVWVPTLSTVGNLLGKGRFREDAVRAILDSALSNVAQFREMDGLLAPGTDAGAWAVPHGCQTEEYWFSKAGVAHSYLIPGTEMIQRKF